MNQSSEILRVYLQSALRRGRDQVKPHYAVFAGAVPDADPRVWICFRRRMDTARFLLAGCKHHEVERLERGSFCTNCWGLYVPKYALPQITEQLEKLGLKGG
jgi:hypothetical protein